MRVLFTSTRGQHHHPTRHIFDIFRTNASILDVRSPVRWTASPDGIRASQVDRVVGNNRCIGQ